MEATNEIIETTELINKLMDERKTHRKDFEGQEESATETDLQIQLDRFQERCRDLQEKLERAEEDALLKAEEVQFLYRNFIRTCQFRF